MPLPDGSHILCFYIEIENLCKPNGFKLGTNQLCKVTVEVGIQAVMGLAKLQTPPTFYECLHLQFSKM